MWKILCITFLFHLTVAVQYVEHVKVTELQIMPNNGILEYNEQSGEIKMLMDIGIYGSIDTPLYFNYWYENDETGNGGTGSDRLCGNNYLEHRREDQRIHTALVHILRGKEKCPLRKGQTYQVKTDFPFVFYDNSDGILITCGNNTAEATLTGTTRDGNMGKIAYTYYITGPKCDA